MDYKRYEDESEQQLLYRICGDKDKIGSWQDVADVLNSLLDKNLSESAYRKKYQAFQAILDANQEIFSDSDKQLEEIKIQKRELAKERQKLSDERVEFNRLIREEARKESFEDLIKRVIREEVEPIDFECNEINSYTSNNDLIVHLTDIHTGIEIDSYINKFNKDILKDRIEKYTNEILSIKETHNSENCYIVIGEILSGLIHNNLRLQNNMDLIEQFKYISMLISEMLIVLSNEFNLVNVYVTMGNHSRIVAKKEESLQGENFDLLLPFYLKASLQNVENISIVDNVIEQSIAMFNVRGYNVFASHGDKDNPSSVVQNWTMMFRIKPDLVLLGHRHTNAMSTVYDTKVIESGCVSGSDPYSISIRKTNKPEQTVSVITNKGLLCIYDVTLD